MLKVLLLDDVEYCVRFYRAALAAKGFAVVAASSGSEAERCCAENPDIDVIIAEPKLSSGENGRIVVEKLVQTLPAVRAMYISAYPLEYLAEIGSVPSVRWGENVTFLAKPFTAQTFLAAVTRLTARSASA